MHKVPETPKIVHMKAPRLFRKYTRGFTLVETMVVVAIVAILASLALPSLQEAFDRYRVNAAYDELRSSYVLARSEAIRTRSTVRVQANGGCPTAQEWQCGWTVFAVINGVNQAPIRRIEALPGGTTIMTLNGGADDRVTFDRWGNMQPLGALRQVIAPRGNSVLTGTRTLCANAGGRVRWIAGDPGAC